MAARQRALIAALALALAAGCRRKEAPKVVAVEAARSALPREAAPAPTPHSAHERSVDVAGVPRRYLLLEPVGRAPERPLPLVFVFHGDGGTPASFHSGFPLERATGGGAFVVYPEGRGRTWDLETVRENPDVAFVDALLEAVARELPVDRARLFAAGYSSGGFFANVLACHRPGLLRAISSSAGGAPYRQAEKWPNGFPRCPGQQPVAVLAMHGEDDRGVTLDSGRFSAEYWAYVNGCRARELETTAYPECRAHAGCPGGKAVVFCAVPGLDHWVWDEGASASWTFFQRAR